MKFKQKNTTQFFQQKYIEEEIEITRNSLEVNIM